MAWLTPAEARALWKDAARITSDSTLQMYLSAAKTAIVAYAAPVTYADSAVPDDWKLAQFLQARNIYNAGLSPASQTADSGFAFSGGTFPLDWTVKQLIRPVIGWGAIA